MYLEHLELYKFCESLGIGLIAMKPYAVGWLFTQTKGVLVEIDNYLHGDASMTRCPFKVDVVSMMHSAVKIFET